MLLRGIPLLVAAALFAPHAHAQAVLAPASAAALDPCSSVPQTVIDVASVKPSDRPSGSSHFSGTADTLSVGGSAFRMILYAYKLHDFQVIGGPGWLTTATWEAIAKVDQPPAGYDSLSNDARDGLGRQRIRGLLAQRFALKCHFETREFPVYNLVLAKGFSKLIPTPSDAKNKGSLDSNGRNGVHRIDGTGVSLEFIAAILSQSLGRTVIDKTGLTGLYNFTLTYASDADAGSQASDAPSGPSIFTALEEQLGLKLESAKGPVQVLVVDHIEKPSED
jgi:uncharacterized protein (TIGR03435 family)